MNSVIASLGVPSMAAPEHGLMSDSWVGRLAKEFSGREIADSYFSR